MEHNNRSWNGMGAQKEINQRAYMHICTIHSMGKAWGGVDLCGGRQKKEKMGDICNINNKKSIIIPTVDFLVAPMQARSKWNIFNVMRKKLSI